MSRKPLVAGNWKMNLTLGQAHELAWNCDQIAFQNPQLEVAVFPSHLFVSEIARVTAVDGTLTVGAQDCHSEKLGSFTGDVSPLQLAECGVRVVLLGHSERRIGHGESDSLIMKKAATAFACGLRVLCCCGETKDQRLRGEIGSVLDRQLRGLESLATHAAGRLDVAYEPVWAIGTGDAASSNDIAEAHLLVRHLLDGIGLETARVLYGGSVRPELSADLIAVPHVDGFLVGGASLNIGAFSSIIETVANARGTKDE